jgi:probable DNA metabolism protein
MILRYDGSFKGYLSLVYALYYENLHVTSIVKETPSTLVFERYYEIFTDEQKAQKVLQALRYRFSKDHFRTIYHTFLCDTKAFEMALLHFIRVGFKDQKALSNINDPDLFFIRNLEKELLSLVHKMYGFTRFEELEDGSLYAKVETKFNVLPFLGAHFSRRLGSIPFIIHDVKRALAFVRNDALQEIRSVSAFDAPNYSEKEAHFKALWKTFFKTAGVQNRYNPKLQQKWVPLMYRTYMSEFQESL